MNGSSQQIHQSASARSSVRSAGQWLALIGLPLLLLATMLSAGELYRHAQRSEPSPGSIIETIALMVLAAASSAGLFCIIAHVQKLSRRRRAHQTVMLRLNAIAAESLGSRGPMSALLAELAELFAQSLSMKATVVTLYSHKTGQMVIRHARGCWWPLEPLRFQLSSLPITEDAFRTGEIYSVADTTRVSGRFSHGKLAERGVRSFLLIPLLVNGKPVGTIQLADTVAYRVGEREREMARLWAAQAAVIIANRQLNHRLHKSLRGRGRLLKQTHQLLEQTTRDADTKKQLLRELNHRVKNNLAGIIGLLSTQPPDLTIHAREWVDRVVQRIGAMSRAHELLLNNSADMPVSALIREIGQLSISNRVKVALEIHDGSQDVSILSEKAMALTMILHELCHNANVYGLADGGTLRIRTRRTGNDSLSIAVEDLPAGNSRNASQSVGGTSSPPPKRKSGIGLELVQAMVSRELQGRFVLRDNDVGGKSAEVVFPVSSQAVDQSRDGLTGSPVVI